MTRKAVSWVLVGAFAYAWWWLGHRWLYINTEGNAWGSVYILFTFISLAVLMRSTKTAGAGMFGGLIGTVSGFLPSLLWMVPAIVVFRAVAWLHAGIVDPVDNLTHAVVAVGAAAFTTSLWYGAIVNATGDS
jgi:hypothetical protein